MTIPPSRSLIFEVKSTGSDLAFGRVRQTSNVFGRLRTSSEIFGNDRVLFKNPSIPRIKTSRFYLRKSWKVQEYCSLNFIRLLRVVITPSVTEGVITTRSNQMKFRLRCVLNPYRPVNRRIEGRETGSLGNQRITKNFQ